MVKINNQFLVSYWSHLFWSFSRQRQLTQVYQEVDSSSGRTERILPKLLSNAFFQTTPFPIHTRRTTITLFTADLVKTTSRRAHYRVI